MALLQWNCNGLRPNGHELKALILNHKIQPSIIALQETLLSPKHNFTIPGYQFIRKDRLNPTNRPGPPHGGLGLFISDSINFQIINIPTPNLETLAIDATINKTKLRIINVYHTRTKPFNIDDLNSISSHLTTNTLILGDFNAHHPLWGTKNYTDKLGTLLTEWINKTNLISLNNNQPTRYPINHLQSPTAIDLSITTPKLSNI